MTPPTPGLDPGSALVTYTLSAASPPYRAGHFSTLLLQDCALNRGPRQWQLLLKNGACNLILLSFSTPSPSRDTNRYIKVRLNIAQFRCLLPIWRSATGSFASILFMVFISASHWFLVLAAGRMLDILDPGSSLTSNSRMILAYSQPIRSVCCNMASRLIFLDQAIVVNNKSGNPRESCFLVAGIKFRQVTSLLAIFFVLRPVLFLTFNAAMSNRFAGGTFLQFDVIVFCDAAGTEAQHIILSSAPSTHFDAEHQRN